MAYQLKSRTEFKKYRKTIEVLPSYDELCIDKFESSSLFDLYKLFTTIKDDRQISSAMQKKLKAILKANFPKEISSLLSFPIGDEIIHNLEEYIKDIFLAYTKHPENFTSTKEKLEEMENLKIIIAKKYPNEFLGLIEEKKNPKEFKLEKEFIEETVEHIVDEYTQHTKEMQNNEDIQTAFYTYFKNKLPDFNIYVPGRKKSPSSVIDNLVKEFVTKLNEIIPSNLEKGLTYTDLTNNFNLNKVSDDYYAFTIVLRNVKDTFHFDKTTPDGKQLMLYRKQRKTNTNYYHDLRNLLDNSFLDLTEEQYLQMKIELLSNLQDLTFQECSEEYNGLLFQPKDENDPRNFFF